MGWFPEQAGGLNRVFFNLMHHLPQQRVDVCGLVTGVCEDAPVGVTGFAPASMALPLRWYHLRRQAARVLQATPVDLVATHFALYAFPLLTLKLEVPWVVHFHGPWAFESAVEGEWSGITRLKRVIERATYRRGGRFIVLSKAFGHLLHRHYGVSWKHIRVVPGGVDVGRFANVPEADQARQLLGWPGDRPVVLVVRRLAQRMGLHALIEAVDSARMQVPDLLVLIAGRGPLAQDLQRHIEERDLQDHVRLLGFVPEDDLPLAYRAATLTMVPTAALEGFGLITLESLAAGTPVLVTPVGGLPEAVQGLSPDLVLTGTSAADLATGMTEALLGRRHLPDALACRDFAQARFDWPVIARRIRAVYEEVLA